MIERMTVVHNSHALSRTVKLGEINFVPGETSCLHPNPAVSSILRPPGPVTISSIPLNPPSSPTIRSLNYTSNLDNHRQTNKGKALMISSSPPHTRKRTQDSPNLEQRMEDRDGDNHHENQMLNTSHSRSNRQHTKFINPQKMPYPIEDLWKSVFSTQAANYLRRRGKF